MKYLIIIILLFTASCVDEEAQKAYMAASEHHLNDSSPIVNYKIIVIDSCEYLESTYFPGNNAGLYSLTHRGRCKYCKQRCLKQ